MIYSENIFGIKKCIFNLRVLISVFFKFLPELFSGKITVVHFFKFLKRMLYFFSKMQHNKFVKIGNYTRIGLYIPGFTSEAFWTACRKFLVFNEKLPCATALISITSACRYDCCHCYQRLDKGKDVDIDILLEIIKKLQDKGIAFFNIEGGEPFLVYERLKKVCSVIDRRSEIWINSTGDGITLERLKELKNLNVTAIMFSMHFSAEAKTNKFMGKNDAYSVMLAGIENCHSAGIAVALNACLQKEGFINGEFQKIMEKAKDLKAVYIQLIKPKSAGKWLSSGADNFEVAELENIKKLVDKYNKSAEYQEYPPISAQIIEEDKGVFGCTAGGTERFYINAKGDLQPCEFLNISFGNISDLNFEERYRLMRDAFHTPCCDWLCEKYSNEILKVYKENDLESLPLSPEFSKEIFNNWDRGNNTQLYKRMK